MKNVQTSYNKGTAGIEIVSDDDIVAVDGDMIVEDIVSKHNDGDGWQEPWRPKVVYHYIQWKDLKPDIVVDVTGFMDKKMEAVLAYKTQFFDPKRLKKEESYQEIK